jgi:TonB family protein
LPESARPGAGNLPLRSLEVAVDAGGTVLDVRFASPEPERAAEIRGALESWRFTPARFEGRPVKSRFALDSRGARLGPSRAPGTPVDPGEDISAPVVSVVVSLPAGRPAPATPPKLRLVVDEAGRVTEASVQTSCGDPALDESALSAARTLQFTPARRGEEAVPVYLNIEARFAPVPAP